MYRPPALPTNVIEERECRMCMLHHVSCDLNAGMQLFAETARESISQRWQPVCPYCQAPVTQAGTEVKFMMQWQTKTRLFTHVQDEYDRGIRCRQRCS